MKQIMLKSVVFWFCLSFKVGVTGESQCRGFIKTNILIMTQFWPDLTKSSIMVTMGHIYHWCNCTIIDRITFRRDLPYSCLLRSQGQQLVEGLPLSAAWINASIMQSYICVSVCYRCFS